jgi:hypothetical protein
MVVLFIPFDPRRACGPNFQSTIMSARTSHLPLRKFLRAFARHARSLFRKAGERAVVFDLEKGKFGLDNDS